MEGCVPVGVGEGWICAEREEGGTVALAESIVADGKGSVEGGVAGVVALVDKVWGCEGDATKETLGVRG